MTAGEFDQVQAVLHLIAQMNINRSAATTFDLGIQECARQEIIQGIAQHYGIVYHAAAQRAQAFPVKGTHA
jgi:hypothetical protein